MKRSTLLFTSALAVMISLGGSARADLIAWTYSWSRAPVSLADPNDTGGVSLTQQSAPQAAVGNSDIVATNLKIFSVASASNPDTLNTGGAYSLALTLTDTASGQSGTLTFTGNMTGTFSETNTNLTNTFNSPTVQSLVLGNSTSGYNTYQVTIGPFSPPGPYSNNTAGPVGSIAAFVEVTAGTPGGGGTIGVQDVPEPSTILLAGLGLSFLGGAAWRKRRQTLTQAAA